VEFDRPSGRVIAETEDLSARGLFIRTEALLPVGEETEIAVELPDGNQLVLFGRVAHMLTPAERARTSTRSRRRSRARGYRRRRR